jgi:uncharacterized membrane protein
MALQAVDPPTLVLVVAVGLGFSAGLRTMTPAAAILLARHHMVAGLVVSLLAVCEWVIDLLPATPARTRPGPLIARVASGAFAGWLAGAGSETTRIVGAIVGGCAALGGAFAGLRARLWAIDRYGGLRAALAEDLVAIGLASLAFLL